MTSPIDNNQHLLAYLQAWRQLLEASAAMTSGLPFPPGLSGMPPMPPMPPATPPMPPMPPMTPPGTGPTGASPPTDYAQQLFGYLQAWRQYLEQAISAAPGTTTQPTGSQPTTTTQPTSSSSTGSQPTGSQSTDSQSTGSTGSQSSGSQSSYGSAKQPIVVGPTDPYGTITDLNTLSGLQELLSGPENRYAYGDRASGSAFAAKAASVGSGPSIQQPTTQSLFGGRAADTPSTMGMQAGPDPRRAAPPATSRWWEAGQGVRPGIKDKPDARNLLNIRPVDLGGEQ